MMPKVVTSAFIVKKKLQKLNTTNTKITITLKVQRVQKYEDM